MELLSGASHELGIQVGISGDANSRINVQLGSSIFSEDAYQFDGTLQAAGSYAVQGRAEYARIADLNGDGVNDLVVDGTSGSSTNILLGNGDGTFKARTAVGSNSESPTLADIDGDGDIDIVASSNGAIGVYQNQGNGTFIQTNGQSVGIPTPDEQAMLRDINGDSKIDWLYVSGQNDVLHVFLGNGDGTFKASNALAAGFDVTGSMIADVNGDGRVDVYVGGAANDAIYFGNSDGTFTAPVAIADAPRFGTPGDINGDGKIDLVGTDSGGSSQIFVALGNGDGTFKTTAAVATESVQGAVRLGDINDDGVLDAVRVKQATGTVYLNLGNSNGTFKAAITVGTSIAQARAAAIGDLNGDGVSDFAIPGYNGNNVSIVLSGSTPGSSSVSFDLTTQSGARAALDTFSSVQTRVSNELGRVGQDQSRLMTASETLRAQWVASEEARSRIMSADIAEESAALVRQQILQQVARAILVQANQVPQLALDLLKG